MMAPINDVILTPLKKIADERGAIFHMLKETDPHYKKFGEVYFSLAYTGVIKGWHEHTEQTQNYCVVSGMIKIVLFDNRRHSSTYGNLQELFLGELNYQLLTIPPGIINGYKCIGSRETIIANCSDLVHRPNEMIRHDPFSDIVPYKWDIVMK